MWLNGELTGRSFVSKSNKCGLTRHTMVDANISSQIRKWQLKNDYIRGETSGHQRNWTVKNVSSLWFELTLQILFGKTHTRQWPTVVIQSLVASDNANRVEWKLDLLESGKSARCKRNLYVQSFAACSMGLVAALYAHCRTHRGLISLWVRLRCVESKSGQRVRPNGKPTAADIVISTW